MAGLLNIAPLAETVDIRGSAATVTGVSVKGIADLIFRFPDLRKAWGAGKFDAAVLLEMSDDIVNAVIAASVEELDEANAANLALDEKAEIIGAAIRVTMPRGPVPFMAALTKLVEGVGAGPSPKARATK